MNCTNCGAPAPEGGKFCKNCGVPLPVIPVETQREKKGPWKALTIVFAALTVVFVALNVVQFFLNRDASDLSSSSNAELQAQLDRQTASSNAMDQRLADQEAQIAELEETITSQEFTIQNQRDDIDSLTVDVQEMTIENSTLRAEVDEYLPGYTAYEDLKYELTGAKIGWAASHFCSNGSLIVLPEYETGKKLTLTAHWPGGGTVYVDYSSDAARLEYDVDSWTTSVDLSVVPYEPGITVATFTNDVDNYSFKILIVVTE